MALGSREAALDEEAQAPGAVEEGRLGAAGGALAAAGLLSEAPLLEKPGLGGTELPALALPRRALGAAFSLEALTAG